MENKFSKIEDREKWQKLLDKALFKTFFHNIEWEEFLESHFKWLKFERYLYKDEAMLSLARVGDKLVSHPFCEYGGPLPLQEKIDFNQFQDGILSEIKGRVRISFHPQILSFFEGAVDGGKSERVSYFLEGQPDFKKSVRYEIKKAGERGVQVKECANKGELESFYRIYLKSAKKHKVPAYPISFFRYFLKSADSTLVLALFENKVIAGSVFLYYDNFVHYFQNAADERYKKTGANYLILQKEIQNKGDKIFDFGGTRRGSSLEVFKKAWGAKERPILEISNYPAGSSLKKSKLRSVYGFLPVFLIRIISPCLLKYKA